MSEKVIVCQNKDYEVGFWVLDPQKPDSDDYQPVHGLHEITPYAMMLIGLATCTAQVVFSYVEHHDVKLDEIEFHLYYDRVYHNDCEDCEKINYYEEKINEQIRFLGDLSQAEKEKLFQIAHHCPIEKMYKQGIQIHSELNKK